MAGKTSKTARASSGAKKVPTSRPDMTAVVVLSGGRYTVWSRRSGRRVTEADSLERAKSKAASKGYIFE